jgi:hypothetical protein
MSFLEKAVILLSRKSGYIFIQTDKPVYTPNQEGNILYRVNSLRFYEIEILP